MIVPDVNLLLYAELAAFSHHERAREWWEALLYGEQQVGIVPAALFWFVRISTNRRVFEEPLAVPDALERVRRWLAQPNVSFLIAGTRCSRHRVSTAGTARHSGEPRHGRSAGRARDRARRRGAFRTMSTSAASMACAGAIRWSADRPRNANDA